MGSDEQHDDHNPGSTEDPGAESERETATASTATSHIRGRLKRSRSGDGHERPRSVYIVLGVGVASLLILLFVIYISSDRSLPERPICSTVGAGAAEHAVLDGRVRSLTLAYDDTILLPTDENWGPVLARIEYIDGQCANLPQGIEHQPEMFRLLGAITVYNDTTENQQVELNYDRTTLLDPMLFATPTMPVTPTIEPTPSPTPSPTPDGLEPVQGPMLDATPAD